MAETLRIEIKDDVTSRPNKDLEDFFNGVSTPAPQKPNPPPLPGGAGPKFPPNMPPLPKPGGGGGKSPTPVGPDYGAASNPMGTLAKMVPEIALLAVVSAGVSDALDSMTKNVNAATDALATFAGNERAGMGKLGEAAAGAIRAPAENIPIVGAMIKSQNDLTDAIIKMPERLTAAFLKQADKIGPYSGAITSATARADVREIMADVREAQSMGEGYGRLIDAQSRLDNTVREMLLPIKKFIVEVLANRLEAMATFLNVLASASDIFQELLKGMLKVLGDIASASPFQAIADVKDTLKKIADIIEKNGKKDDLDLFDQFFADVGMAKFSGNFAG